ncbi:MAG: EAL domain-containing protein [Hyphomonadaceae bacterium]
MSWRWLKESVLGPIGVPEPYRQDVRANLHARFLQFTTVANTYGLIVASVMVLILLQDHHGLAEHIVPIGVAWFGALALIVNQVRGDVRDPASISVSRILIGTTVASCVWGSLIFTVINHAQPEQDLYVGLFIACVFCAGAFARSSMPASALIYSCVLAASIMLALVLDKRDGLLQFAFLLGASVIGLQLFSILAARRRAGRIASLRALERSHEIAALQLQEFEAQSADWMWRIDDDGRLVDVSPKFAQAAGADATLLQGERFLALFAPEAEEHFDALLRSRRAFRDMTFEIQVPRGSRWWSISGTPTTDGGYKGVCSDVTRRHEAETKAAFVSEFDHLTGLSNRAALVQQLEAACAGASGPGDEFALLYVDIDSFKTVNDTHGHAAGDEFLKEIAERLQDAAGEDAFVSRLGGDEFAVLLRASSRDMADEIADHALDAMLAPVIVGGREILGSGSIGAVIGPGDGADAATLLKHAELALYRAKAQGRGCSRFFEGGMEADARQRADLESDLRRALFTDAMDLHFQPLVDTRSGRVCAYETLLRWNRPGHGLVSPVAFIGCAEETGIIVPLGEWVIRNAVKEAAQWRDDVTVAVNLSPEQMRNPSIVQVVVSALSSAELDPGRLEIEITESVLMKDSEANLRTLHALREVGVKIALDDFGTGFSSLSYLRTFPFDKLKIDQSFVRDIHKTPENQAIVRAIISLARDLGMRCTAEGVENEQQAAILASLGCTEVQGYLFSRPVPAAELPKKPAAQSADAPNADVRNLASRRTAAGPN